MGQNSDEILQAEIKDLKIKQEEIRSQQMSFKQETESHISTWAQVVKGKDKAPPLIAVEEVVQAKLVEERTRRARELNLKVRGLPTRPPSADPMDWGTGFYGQSRHTRHNLGQCLDREGLYPLPQVP